MICAAKFPKKVEVAAYTQIRKPLRDALTAPNFGRDDLDFLLVRLEDKARREEGYQRDEALRCAAAVKAFQSTFNPRSFSRYSLNAATSTVAKVIEGVRVKVSLDAVITTTENDCTFCGGVVMLYAFAANRGDMSDRLQTTAGLTLWALEGGQMEPLPRLCLAADIAEQKIVKASASHGRFRARVSDSCKEVATLWAGVEPPSDYDGPAWR